MIKWIYLYICVCLYECIHACMCIWVDAYMVYMYVCMYVCIYLSIYLSWFKNPQGTVPLPTQPTKSISHIENYICFFPYKSRTMHFYIFFIIFIAEPTYLITRSVSGNIFKYCLGSLVINSVSSLIP